MIEKKLLFLLLVVLTAGCNTAQDPASSEIKARSGSKNSVAKKKVSDEVNSPVEKKENGEIKQKTATAEQKIKPKPSPQSMPAFGSEKTYVSKACGMKFIRIEPGTFIMGTPKDSISGWEDERQHEVEITKPFYLGRYEVTREQWQKIKHTKPWDRDKAHWLINAQKVEDQSRWPATSISWENAKSFLEALSKRDGHRYRLPTEAEWEYACRAGTTTHFFCGDDETNLHEYAWIREHSKAPTTVDGDRGQREHTVGLLKPNPWGLYDMSGNVKEWCEDWYDRDFYSRSPLKDPVNNQVSRKKVQRGGSYYYDRGCRSAHRESSKPDKELFLLSQAGFRVVCEIVESDPPAIDATNK